jgi:hypothetical protein
MRSFFRKLGLVGSTFFVANALAAVVSLILLLMRSRRQTVPQVTARCPVCGALVPGAAKYCSACGSRV